MLIILVGKSGSGKDTIKNELINSIGCEPLISTTTRPPRPSEVNGREYHFISKEEFEAKIKSKAIFEYREYESNNGLVYYGMEYKPLDPNKNYIKILDPQGASNYIEAYGRQRCFVVEIFADEQLRHDRAYKREFANASPCYSTVDVEIRRDEEEHFEYEWEQRAKDDNERFGINSVFSVINYTLFNNEDDKTIQNITEDFKSAFECYCERMKEFTEIAHLHTEFHYPQLLVDRSTEGYFTYTNDELNNSYNNDNYEKIVKLSKLESLGEYFDIHSL